MKFRQYSTNKTKEGLYLKSGYRQCVLCGKKDLTTHACKCSVKVRLEGDSDVIGYALDQLSKVAKVFIPAPYEYGGGVDSTAEYITVYVANPDCQWDMDAINQLGRLIEQ